MTDTFCGLCPAPTRDGAYLCDACGDLFAHDLRDIADWITDELETALTGEKGARAHPTPGGSGGDGLRVNWAAAAMGDRMRTALATAVAQCRKLGIVNTDPYPDLTPDPKDIANMARWLVWRVDGLCLHPAGPRHAGMVRGLVLAATRIVDCPPDREYLGSCLECDRGRLFVTAAEPFAVCDMCRVAYDAHEMRAYVLARIDDQIMTAAEIARVSTYLGLRDDRDRVRKRINVWHKRGTIVAQPSMTGETVFRFGDIWRRLMAEE